MCFTRKTVTFLFLRGHPRSHRSDGRAGLEGAALVRRAKIGNALVDAQSEQSTKVGIYLVGPVRSAEVVKVECAIVEVLVIVYVALCVAKAGIEEVGILYELIVCGKPGVVLCLGDKP